MPMGRDEEKNPLLDSQQTQRSSFFLRLWRRDLFPWISARHTLALMSFLGFCNVYALRVNLSMAIVEMDNSTVTVRRGAEVFDWSSSETGWVLAAFFYGYLFTQIPGGWLAERFGGKWVFGVGVVMTSILTLVTPLAASWNIWVLVAVRVLEGLFEGVTYPAMHATWAKWAPPAERTRLTSFTYAGALLGTIISFPLSGLLCQHGFTGGWPSVFYVFGVAGILWFILWSVMVSSSPATHPRISLKEKEYIISSIASEVNYRKKPPTPWLKIFTSPHVWAIIIAHLCFTWGGYTLLTCIPTYFRQALPNIHLGSSKNSIVLTGVFSALPYTLLFVLTILTGPIADYLRARWLSTVAVRKLVTTVSFLGQATFLLLCGYLGTTTATAVPLLTLAVGLGGFGYSGWSVNHLDIAPPYAGVLMGITNVAATIPGFVGPQLAKAIAVTPPYPRGSQEYLDTFREEWQQVFLISAEVYVFGAIIYLILASGTVQPWAMGSREDSGSDDDGKVKKLQDSSMCNEDKEIVGPNVSINS